MARSCSPMRVVPGARTSRTDWPRDSRRWRRRVTWVLFPLPSEPSKTMKRPVRGMAGMVRRGRERVDVRHCAGFRSLTVLRTTPTFAFMRETAAIKSEFARTFGDGGRRVHVIRAPGRVNLIGEHTDYNEGFVCPMAIEPEVRVVCRAREDGVVRLASTAFPGQVAEFSVEKKIERAEPA